MSKKEFEDDGWIVEVETASGAALYVCRISNPFGAEDKVKTALNITDERDVFAVRPVDRHHLDNIGVASGDIKGPM